MTTRSRSHGTSADGAAAMVRSAASMPTASAVEDRGRAPLLLSVNVGLPRPVRWNGTSVYTGIHKSPVTGPRTVRRLNVDGDGQGDPDGHGGEQRAVLVYQQDSYEHWARFLRRDDLTPGSFGENFTVSGLPDDEVCIGDRYRIGTAEFEVTQPRVTCFRVGMRLGVPELPALLVSHGRPGFYLRVVTEGEVSAGDPVRKTRSGHHQLSVAAVDALLYLSGRNPETLRKAVEVSALSPGWHQSFSDLLDSDLASATVAGPTAEAEPAWPGFRRMYVTGVTQETPSVSSYHLRDDSPAPPARPGQYLTLRLGDGTSEAPLVRSYSISAQERPGHYRITVRRDEHGRAGRFLHDRVRVGSTVDVAAPRGDFVLRTDDAPLVLASAGVGVTPLMAMLRELGQDKHPGPVWWIHVARSRAEHVFAAEAQQLLEHLPGSRAALFYTRSARADRADAVHRGRPDARQLGQLGLPSTAHAYLCGPPAFITELSATLRDLGLEPGRIHAEHFSGLPSLTPGVAGGPDAPPHQPAETARGRWSRSPAAASAHGGANMTCRCSSWPRPAPSRPGGRAGPASATRALFPSSRAPSATGRSRWSHRPPGRPCCAALGRPRTWSSTSDGPDQENTMDYRIEVVTLPVTGVDAAVAFYRDRLGFRLDVDWAPTGAFRVAQLTPPGSAASIQLGVGVTAAEPGSATENYLVVTDIEAAHAELTRRGAAPGPVVHKADRQQWAGRYRPGSDLERADYASSFTVTDPDGNTWRVQERGYQGGPTTTGSGDVPAS